MSKAQRTSDIKLASWSELKERSPAYARVSGVDLVMIKHDGRITVLYGRCMHRGALMSDGRVEGRNLLCSLHAWDYRMDTGVSEYSNSESLHKFNARVDENKDAVYVDENEILEWEREHPQPYKRNEYLGLYADIHGTPEEPYNRYIDELSRKGPEGIGHHGRVSAMGVPLTELPRWEDIQIVTAQLLRPPLLDDEEVDTTLVIGPAAKKPLELKIPLLVSDMSFGALSREAKIALARGAEAAGTGICSGEGGMLPEEKNENSRYLYEFASGKFGWSLEKAAVCAAFHFKAGQGAKTGTGGHLPGEKVTAEIAKVRGLEEGQPAVSPARFEDLITQADYRRAAEQVREASGGIPIGFKMSAQHIEDDIDFALAVGVDYIILDGRGGGTGAAPELFKNNISVPTIPALARAKNHLAKRKADNVTLIITGGLRIESHFIKALALGADGVALANSAIQAVGCLAMRACHTDNCPVGIATQKDDLRKRLIIDESAQRLVNYLNASVYLMQIMARACGHKELCGFSKRDLVTYEPLIAHLAGVKFGGVEL